MPWLDKGNGRKEWHATMRDWLLLEKQVSKMELQIQDLYAMVEELQKTPNPWKPRRLPDWQLP